MIPKKKKNLSNAKLSLIIIGVIMTLGLFLIPLIVRASDWTDNFESYNLGDFYNNSNWQVSTSGVIYIINNLPAQSYPQNLEFSKLEIPKLRSITKSLDISQDSGTFKFYWNVKFNPDEISAIRIKLYDLDNQECIFLNGLCLDVYCEKWQWNYYTANPPEYINLGIWDIPTGWHSISFQWDTYSTTSSDKKMRYKVDDGFWSSWETIHNPDYCDNAKKLSFHDEAEEYSDDYYIYFDSFSQTIGYGICGTELDCIYCKNQIDCENNNCSWLEFPVFGGYFNTCVPTPSLIEEIMGTELEPLPFYASNSEFATPTALYTGLTGVSSGIFKYLSSWLSRFSNLFDLTQATQKGVEYGQAIPKARGYLNIFNNLFGNLPLGEIFIIYLTILIAVIIFRIVRHSKGLLPFQ